MRRDPLSKSCPDVTSLAIKMQPEQYCHIIFGLTQAMLYKVTGAFASISFALVEKDLSLRVFLLEDHSVKDREMVSAFEDSIKKKLPEYNVRVEQFFLNKKAFSALEFETLEHPVFLRNTKNQEDE